MYRVGATIPGFFGGKQMIQQQQFLWGQTDRWCSRSRLSLCAAVFLHRSYLGGILDSSPPTRACGPPTHDTRWVSSYHVYNRLNTPTSAVVIASAYGTVGTSCCREEPQWKLDTVYDEMSSIEWSCLYHRLRPYQRQYVFRSVRILFCLFAIFPFAGAYHILLRNTYKYSSSK